MECGKDKTVYSIMPQYPKFKNQCDFSLVAIIFVWLHKSFFFSLVVMNAVTVGCFAMSLQDGSGPCKIVVIQL